MGDANHVDALGAARQPWLEVEQVPTADLVPYANNSKIHTDAQVDHIAASIERFGMCDPVGAWRNPETGELEIVTGHGRVLAMQRLGREECPVIMLDHLTDEERRAYSHVNNTTNAETGIDWSLLAADMADLPAIDWDGMGLADAAVETGAFDEGSVHEVDVPDEEQVEPRVKPGEVWLLGDHRLMCGDSTDAAAMDLLTGGVKPKMVFTDPPYGVAIGSKNRVINEVSGKDGRIEVDIKGDTMSTDELYAMLVRAFANLKAHCDDGCSYYVSSPQGGELGLMMMMMRDAGLPVRHMLIWVKNAPVFSMGRLDYDYRHEPIFYTWTKRHEFYGAGNSVIDDNKPLEKMSKSELKELVHLLRDGAGNSVIYEDKPTSSRLHPTMKPVKLVARFMHNNSRKGDPVMDIFGGSGTTMMAAEQLGRRCYMMEVDPHYCDVIIERWERLTGRTAEREEE